MDLGKKGYKLKMGDSMPKFSLIGTDDRTYSNVDLRQIVVITFWCNHCPYVHGAEEQFISLVEEYRNIADFVCINSNDAATYPEDSFEAMKKRPHSYTYLWDETQETAKAFGAECTPHVFVFRNGALVYQGRVDDAGQDSQSASTHELQDALEDLRANRNVQVPLTAARGCSIKWKQ